MEYTTEICGVKIRVVDWWPDNIIGMDNGQFLTLFWQGAEIARIQDGQIYMKHDSVAKLDKATGRNPVDVGSIPT